MPELSYWKVSKGLKFFKKQFCRDLQSIEVNRVKFIYAWGKMVNIHLSKLQFVFRKIFWCLCLLCTYSEMLILFKKTF